MLARSFSISSVMSEFSERRRLRCVGSRSSTISSKDSTIPGSIPSVYQCPRSRSTPRQCEANDYTWKRKVEERDRWINENESYSESSFGAEEDVVEVKRLQDVEKDKCVWWLL